MLSSIQQLLYRKSAPKIDLTRFGHPLAMKTEWFPLQPKGFNFQTYELQKTGPNRLVLRSTFWMQFLYIFVICFGVPFFVVGFLFFFQLVDVQTESDHSPVWGGVIFMIGGTMIMLLGIYFLMRSRVPLVFDRKMGHFETVAPSTGGLMGLFKVPRRTIRLHKIGAIQVLSEWVSAKPSFLSHEINLILEDGSRIPVIDHSSRLRIMKDAKRLGRFLDVPVWSAR